MQKLVGLELFAERIPKDPGIFFRKSFPEVQALLDEGWTITDLSSSYINQNVYVISLVLDQMAGMPVTQRLISLEIYAERIPRTPGYLFREYDLATKEGDTTRETEAPDSAGQPPVSLVSIREELQKGWRIQLMNTDYVNENVYVITLVLEKE